VEWLKMSEAEDALLAKAVQGDGDALSELLVLLGPQIEAGLDGKIGAHHRAAFDEADVLQVTYLEAFLRIRYFEPNGVGSFVRWLRRIAENNLLDAVRALDRDKRPPRDKQVANIRGEDTFVTLLGLLTGTTGTPSRYASKAEAKTALERALASLPDDYATVVRKLDLECRPVGEVAESLERSKGAVHMLRARAYDRLRELMGSASQFFTDSP
jgi:RNA polymerase sigma-70 factor, ECF subfamily